MIDDNKINVGFDELDAAMEKIVNIHKLNMFEVLTIPTAPVILSVCDLLNRDPLE